MKKLILIAFIGIFTSCNAQQKVTAVKDQSGHLIGFADKESFNQAPFKAWFDQEFKTYNPEAATITSLKTALKGITIKGFMGTWCGDSKRETPRFFKISEMANFKMKNFELVTVNHSKKTPDNLQAGLNIFKVPTFIFYKDGKEIGRYVEYARVSLEKDILKIVTGMPYKHSYDRSK
jgi:thiol-disulfide isomerase/thioredoxin